VVAREEHGDVGLRVEIKGETGTLHDEQSEACLLGEMPVSGEAVLAEARIQNRGGRQE
jgi:hypothetical protein